MNNKDNSKVPIAVLSCFLIAFILQGILKISGVFIFEKALDWEIFKIIDNSKYLTICYYSSIIMLIQYCLSFSFVGNITIKKWYHYVLILLSSTLVPIIRMNLKLTQPLNMFLDITLYVIIPVIINLTSNKQNRLFKRDVSDFVITISMQISLYFCYLGLTYWSSMLNSIIVLNPTWVSSSRAFLIYFELYLGLITFMLGMNMLINKIKRREYMIMPVNIASDDAKEKELEEKDTNKK